MTEEKRKNYTTDGKVTHFSPKEEINEKLGRIIGEKFVHYRSLWDEIHEFEKVAEFPLFLQIHPNQNCNYRCPHCLIGQTRIKKEYHDPGIDWDIYERIVLEGEEHGCPSISVQGWNEPLLMKNLENYIKFAHSHGFIDIMFNTNGSLLSEERSKKLLDSGLTRIRFSIDAVTRETYKKVRLSEDFEKVIKNINRFLELREEGGYQLPVVGVSFCKISSNEHEVNAFLDLWEDKVDMVTIQTFMPPVLDPVFNEFYSSNQCERGNIPSTFRCPQPFERVGIHHSEIYPCCYYSDSNLKIGELNKNTIYEAWNSKKAKYLRKMMREGEYRRIKTCENCIRTTFAKV